MAKQVLLVEDNMFLASVLKARLDIEGIEVQHAASGNAAVKFIEDSHYAPDLVVLDLILPEKSGFEILKLIRETPHLAQVAVLVVSNLGSEKDISVCKDLGVKDYCIKADISIDALVTKIKGFL